MILPYLSASRIKTFEQCPLKYYAKYEEKLPDVVHELTLMGSGLHRGMELATKTAMDGGKVNFPAQVRKACASMKIPKPNADLAAKLAENAIKWGYLRNIEYCHGVEMRLSYDLPDGTKVKGVIDRLDFFQNFYDIIDLKTQKREFPDMKGFLLKDEWQTIVYNWLVRQFAGLEDIDVRVSYWVLRHRVQRCWMTKEDTKKSEEKLMRKADEIRNCTNPRPKPSALCSWCPKQHDCPASEASIRKMIGGKK